jgi:hypothetical protein
MYTSNIGTLQEVLSYVQLNQHKFLELEYTVYKERFGLHCPETHEQLPSSFGNAEVITSDGSWFMNFFFNQKSLVPVHDIYFYDILQM